MNRLQTAAAALKARLPRFQDNGQKRALANAALFFALMLALTLVARGTAAANMPVIETVGPVRGEIVQRIEQEGLVQGGKGEAQQVLAGFTVQEVPVSAGQTVKEGDVIARLDIDEITQELDRERVALQKLQLQVGQLTKQSDTDRSALKQARQALTWAREDLDDAVEQNDNVVDEAKDTYLDARDALSNAKWHLSEVEKKPDVTEEELADAQKQVEEAQADFDVAKEAFYTADENADAQITAADRSVTNAENAYEAALAAAQKAEEQAQQQEATDAVEAKMLTLDIKEKQERIAKLETLKKNEGVCSAPKAGVLRELSLAEGQKTADTPAFYIADDTVAYLLEFTLTEEQAQQVKVGDTVAVTQDRTKVQAAILSLTAKGDDGSMTAAVKLPEGNWKDGQQARAQLELSRKQYALCLPISAVHSGSGGDYVLAVEEQNTVLGLQNVLHRVPVTVEEADENQIAVTGALFDQSVVVKSSSRPVDDGDRVRVEP